MKQITVFAAAPALITAPAPPARADDLISVGAGYFDALDDDPAADFRFEYRFDNPSLWQVKPWLASSDGAVYALGGVLSDIVIDDNWLVTPSLAPGFTATAMARISAISSSSARSLSLASNSATKAASASPSPISSTPALTTATRARKYSTSITTCR